MDKTEMSLAPLDRLIASLAPERLGEIDFDRLREMLVQQRTAMAGHAALKHDLDTLRTEHETLRQDFIDRIAGMAKAVAVVTHRGHASRQTGTLSDAIEYVASLRRKSAAELIEQYRLTSARFREAFPTSFLHLRARSGETIA